MIDLTSSFILSVSISEPEYIFPNSLDESKSLYHNLMKKWHPDVNKTNDAVSVSNHLSKLYDSVCDKIQRGAWTPAGHISFKSKKDGKTRVIKYLKRSTFELGEMLYGDKVLTYVIRSDCSDLFHSAIDQIKSLPYKNDDMRKEISRYMPDILDYFECEDGRHVLVIAKTSDVFLMRDVMSACGGTIDPKHAAWMISSLLNLACYLNYANIGHLSISPDTCFVSPQHHSVLLLGGWWYATEFGNRIKALPSRTVSYAPIQTMQNKISSPGIDLSLIRATGREILGDISGTVLSKDVPPAMKSFLRGAVNYNIVDAYKEWSTKTLIESFGPRKFVEMKISPDSVYASNLK